ncbi:MgtC/SapB family protein [Roseococcus thiosulfatophilus]|uniref:MgtC/SapB family protein n=1 Tax=Roseococcus thiosulfatophilus TaxID=35813 RepID=UPI001A8E30B5|nr:MgtC/SapB family protein [Roseococcus thiosulfatophilus]
MEINDYPLRLALALLLGAAIGAERQWRQRMAGLRTNALVALGACCFTVFGLVTPGDASPTRVAAQVVTGIGFLGAGVIMREGLNIRGLNTAATLWCAAAVGVFCGAGAYLLALAATGLIIGANLGLRPLVRLIDRQPDAGSEVEHAYRISVTCKASKEAHIRALLVQAIAGGEVRLRRLDSEDLADPASTAERVVITAELASSGRAEALLEAIVGRLSLEGSVTRAGWAEAGGGTQAH